MTARLSNLKPSASRRTHLLAAAVVWSVVGLGLFSFGTVWLVQTETSYLPWLALAALVGGGAKGAFVLQRTASRSIARIYARGDGRCLGGFFSFKTWLLVAVMMAGGRLLRSSDLPREIVGTIYAAIGTALLVGSIAFWGAARKFHAEV